MNNQNLLKNWQELKIGTDCHLKTYYINIPNDLKHLNFIHCSNSFIKGVLLKYSDATLQYM